MSPDSDDLKANHEKPKVCIAGANGFIGSHVADTFVEACIPTLCQLRSGSSESTLKDSGYDHQLLHMDLDTTESIDYLAQSFKGLKCVIHVAGRSCDWGSYQQFALGNLVATRNICEAAGRAGAKRLILAG